MQHKIPSRLSQFLLSVILLIPVSTYSSIVYIPRALRECINVAYEAAQSENDRKNLQELHGVIQANRILTSDVMARKGITEALGAVQANKNQFRNQKQFEAIKTYFQKYLSSLDNASVLFAIQGEGARSVAWPVSLVARSLPADSVGLDMMYLTSQLASTNNVQLSGNVDINYALYKDLKGLAVKNVLKACSNVTDPSLVFNASDMTNSLSTFPNVVFGTGVSSPSINAWAMTASDENQSPITLQFAVPSNLRADKPISLELHFLVEKNFAPDGNARIQVEAEYMHQNASFDILDSNPAFDFSNESSDFMVIEPIDTDSLRHIVVIIPLEKSGIKPMDLAILSLTRIAPNTGPEYDEDLYLAAAAFRYTANSSW